MADSNDRGGEFFMTGADNSGGPAGGGGETNTTTEMGTANNSGPILQPTPRMTTFQRLVQKVELAVGTLNEEGRALRKAKAALAKATLAKEVAMSEVADARLGHDVAVTRRDRAIASAMQAYLSLPKRVQSAAHLRTSASSSSATQRSGRVREV
ncbi:hypothetical protein BC567DRAFT_267591 [Phyllosticta citribraziliensis]